MKFRRDNSLEVFVDFGGKQSVHHDQRGRRRRHHRQPASNIIVVNPVIIMMWSSEEQKVESFVIMIKVNMDLDWKSCV